MSMRALPHGYTNRSVTDEQVVTKTYLGPDAAQRQAREELALRRLAGLLPVPTLLAGPPGSCTTALVAGVPGQAAIAAGQAAQVLRACGRVLVELQRVDPRILFDAQPEAVLVHNDFGPNNVVMSPNLQEVRLLCDWEWVTVGHQYTDLAWAEWIVRTHHPESVDALPALFEAYGDRPDWQLRQAAMTERAELHRRFVAQWHGVEGEAVWDQRLADIASWVEV